jgi:hypothetical protein
LGLELAEKLSSASLATTLVSVEHVWEQLSKQFPADESLLLQVVALSRDIQSTLETAYHFHTAHRALGPDVYHLAPITILDAVSGQVLGVAELDELDLITMGLRCVPL